MTPQEALRVLQQLGSRDEPVPDGYRTCQEWADVWGKGRKRAYELLAEGERAGLVKRTSIRRGGRITPHYFVSGANEGTRKETSGRSK